MTLAKPSNPDEHPIINTPYDPPQWHWELDGQVRAIGNAIDGRRPSQDIPPIVGQNSGNRGQRTLSQSKDIIASWDELTLVNVIREAVQEWKEADFPGVTAATHQLIEHWLPGEGDDKPSDSGLYHAQLDAVLTHIYLLEGHKHAAYGNIHQELTAALDEHLPRMGGIQRICHKMATGTGKTTVMAMLILYHASNHAADPGDDRFTNQFLVVCPNTTVRERLKPSLRPNEDQQHDDYAERNLLPHPHEQYRDYLNRASIAVANWHQMQPKSIGDTYGSAQLNLLRGQDAASNPNQIETPLAAVLRAADLPEQAAGRIMVINDEAHHCHYGDPQKPDDPPTEWLKALKALKSNGKLHGKVVDMSATPFFVKNNSSNKNKLFPWIVSDCGLIEAQEAGLTKIARAPVSRDDSKAAEFRSIYDNTPTERQGRKFNGANDDNCRLFKEALNLAAEDYTTQAVPDWVRSHKNDGWSANLPAIAIVTDQVGNANAVYEYIASGGITCTPINETDGNPFTNFQPGEKTKQWISGPPRTIVVHSEIDNPDHKSGVPTRLKASFKQLADRYREYYEEVRNPDLNDEGVIRLVMNTVGKPGKPGEHVRCIISVSMLTEGWDAQNVTHLVGFRPFKSSLLCEQVAGRTLRRSVWDPDENGLLSPEYACVLGIPFREKGNTKTSAEVPSLPIITVATPDDRSQFAIQWPNIIRLDRVEHDMAVRAHAKPVSQASRLYVPEYHEIGMHVAPTIGAEQAIPNTPPNTRRRFAYELAGQATQMLIQDLENDDTSTVQLRVNVLFSDLLTAFEQHVQEGNISPPRDETQWPSDVDTIADAANWLHRHVEYVIPTPPDGRPPMTPVKGKSHWLNTELRREYTIRDNPKMVYANCRKSHATHAKCDSSWEVTVAKALDNIPVVTRWARNSRLGWEIPYVHEGQPHVYQPDFVAVAELPDGRELHLVVEVKGIERESDRVKRRWTEAYWIPAVNSDAEYGDGKQWQYLYLDAEAMAHAEHHITTTINEARNSIA